MCIVHVALFYVCHILDMAYASKYNSFNNKTVDDRKLSSKLLLSIILLYVWVV